MSTKHTPALAEFNDDDMREFTRLVALGESARQMDRITSRMEFPKFVEKHGKEKCDAMFTKLIGKEPV